MGKLQSVKDILVSNNIFKPEKKPTAFEFQDYAYNLAKDLNDLENIKIYMRLCKTVDRSILENTFSFVIDANVENKGKLFFWKLKKNREFIKEKINLKNFETKYCLDTYKSNRGNFNTNLFSTEPISQIFEKYKNKINFSKVLFLNPNSTQLILEFSTTLNVKVFIYEISKTLVLKLKEQIDKKNIKISLKNIFGKKNKKVGFELIFGGKTWLNLPLEAEVSFLEHLISISNNPFYIFLQVRLGHTSTQTWTNFANSKYLSKENTKVELFELLKKLNFEILEILKIEDTANNFEILLKYG